MCRKRDSHDRHQRPTASEDQYLAVHSQLEESQASHIPVPAWGCSDLLIYIRLFSSCPRHHLPFEIYPPYTFNIFNATATIKITPNPTIEAKGASGQFYAIALVRSLMLLRLIIRKYIVSHSQSRRYRRWAQRGRCIRNAIFSLQSAVCYFSETLLCNLDLCRGRASKFLGNHP